MKADKHGEGEEEIEWWEGFVAGGDVKFNENESGDEAG